MVAVVEAVEAATLRLQESNPTVTRPQLAAVVAVDAEAVEAVAADVAVVALRRDKLPLLNCTWCDEHFR